MIESFYQPFPMETSARAQIWHYWPTFRRPRHFHAEPELNLISAGSGAFAFGDQSMSVEAGDLIWWPPGQDHELLAVSPDFDMLVVGVTSAFSERVLGAGVRVPNARRVRLPRDVLSAASDLRSVPLVDQDGAAFERIVGDFWRQAHAQRSHTSDQHTLASRVLARLLREPDLSRAELARALHVHPTDVSRCFHRANGLTLGEYRTRLRLVRFIAAVDESPASLSGAARRAGFGSYSQCHRAFRATLGCTPRDFFELGRRQIAETFAPF